MGDKEDRNRAELTNKKADFLEDADIAKKLIRIITVVVYLFSVSMAAIVLSLYYLFFWNPTVQTGAERLVDTVQLRVSQFYYDGTRKVSRGSTNGAVGSEIKFAGNDKEKMYEPKHRRRLVRVLTVIAYLFSVSLAAIMLSLFYVFIYNPTKTAGESGQDQSVSRFPTRVGQGSLDSTNDTYLNMDSEEPRVLPIKEFNNPFWSRSEGTTEGDQIHFNYSVGSGSENKTILHKIIKLLKTK